MKEAPLLLQINIAWQMTPGFSLALHRWLLSVACFHLLNSKQTFTCCTFILAQNKGATHAWYSCQDEAENKHWTCFRTMGEEVYRNTNGSSNHLQYHSFKKAKPELARPFLLQKQKLQQDVWKGTQRYPSYPVPTGLIQYFLKFHSIRSIWLLCMVLLLCVPWAYCLSIIGCSKN